MDNIWKVSPISSVCVLQFTNVDAKDHDEDDDDTGVFEDDILPLDWRQNLCYITNLIRYSLYRAKDFIFNPCWSTSNKIVPLICV